MKELENLLEKYENCQIVSTINKTCEGKTSQKIVLNGTVGSQDNYFIVGLHNRTHNAQLYIANDKETAAYAQNTLSNIYEDRDVLLFLDSCGEDSDKIL